MTIKYASVCSGIEAPSMAWHSLGWEPVWFSEIEKFPSAVLAHHYPKTPNLGDMTKLKESEVYNESQFNLLVGGTPCQSFSVAGLRGGLSDDRGNLALEFCRILLEKQPQWFVWENVPGVFSSNGGEDFRTIISAFTEIGYGVAWRVLDAQHFGVAQRRRRVFVVGCFGDWRAPARVLFEPESLQGDTQKSGKKRKNPTAFAENGFRGTVGTLCRRDYKGPNSDDLEAGKVICGTQNDAMRDAGDNISPTLRSGSNGGAVNPCVAYGVRSANTSSNGWGVQEEKIHTPYVTPQATPYAYSKSGRPSDKGRMGSGIGGLNHPAPTLSKGHSHAVSYSQSDNYIVRRLTPIECERLQGFPDNFTNIPWRGKPTSPHGQRYKALGNSMAVPVMKWIGERIDEVNKELKCTSN